MSNQSNDPSGISVLVRTYNSATSILRLLSKLNQEPIDQIIIVDSGSTDETCSLAEHKGCLVLHAPPPFNYSKSLNIGFASANSEWVHVISSHSIPLTIPFLPLLKSELAKLPAHVMAAYAPCTISGKCDFPELGTETKILGPEQILKYPGICGNANTVYRKSAWERIPFDESIRTGEDKDWLTKAAAAGFHFASIPHLRCLNKSNYSLGYMFRKGYSDSIALPKGHDFKPMKFRHLLGAEKNMFLRKVRGEIDWGNWARYSAHILGVFFGSKHPQDNTPDKIQLHRR